MNNDPESQFGAITPPQPSPPRAASRLSSVSRKPAPVAISSSQLPEELSSRNSPTSRSNAPREPRPVPIEEEDYDLGSTHPYSNAYIAVPKSGGGWTTPPKGVTKKDSPYGSTPQFDTGFQQDTPTGSPFDQPLRPQYARGYAPGFQRADSQSHLLSHPFEGTQDRTPPPYGYADPKENRIPFWQREWLMYALFVLGFCSALGHHFFYKSLDGKDAVDQGKMLRYGSVLSFLTKAAVTSVAIMAFRQRVWVTVRREMMTLGSIDSLFAAAEDVNALAHIELYSKAKLAVVLAVFIWATPLVVILTSETLSVEAKETVQVTKCPGVRTLNFTHEDMTDWRVPTRVAGEDEVSLNVWNETMTKPESGNDTNFFDYYTTPSRQFEQVAQLSILLGEPRARASAANDICGNGWNCTFWVNFTAPGYKCTELARGINSDPKPLGNAISPIKISDIIPQGNYSYYAQSTLGEYAVPQWDVGDAGHPKAPPPYPSTLGAFKVEPIIWIGYADVQNKTDNPPLNSTSPNWNEYFTPTIIGCEHYYTHYNMTFAYNLTAQNVTVTERQFLTPVINTTFIAENATDGTWDNTTATPTENFIYPRNIEKYRHTAAFHSAGLMLRRYINGTIKYHNTITESDVLQTRLIDLHHYFMVSNFMDELQSVYEDIIVSLFSNPSFVAVSWAAEPQTLAGNDPGTEDRLMYPCTRSRISNVFQYDQRALWLVYSAALFLTALALAAGHLAVYENDKVVRDISFSSIVAATRGPHLDRLDWSLHDGQVSRRTRSALVGYGVVGESEGFASGLGIHSVPGLERRRMFSPQLGASPELGRGVATPQFGFGVLGSVRQGPKQRPSLAKTFSMDNLRRVSLWKTPVLGTSPLPRQDESGIQMPERGSLRGSPWGSPRRSTER